MFLYVIITIYARNGILPPAVDNDDDANATVLAISKIDMVNRENDIDIESLVIVFCLI